ncbi:MAG: hypothetical protein DI528_00355 [Shinella sp.]|nr:MAG: hypothetical protein DI528_00355 [Shinella sp.]
MHVFRLSRSLGADIAVRDFVDMARPGGASTWWVMFREVLPRVIIPLIADEVLRLLVRLQKDATCSSLVTAAPCAPAPR